MNTLAPETIDASRELNINSHPASGLLMDKVVIVTGSVGNLGLATARACQEAGARTVLVDCSTDRLRENYPDLVDSPNHLLAGGVDLGKPESRRSRVRQPAASATKLRRCKSDQLSDFAERLPQSC